MALNTKISKQSEKPKKIKIFVVDQYVCNFIKTEWMKDLKSFREWGRQHSVHEAVARKINQKEGYNIPVSTLKTICFYKQITMYNFFKLVEEKYGDAQDKFYYIEK
ncbi:hypothetical protein [Flavobacterium sp. HJJ]|uniref:hypothetical protein n=1 Tax=Flavobacterium sp. HJJ TaxID=2783792 RepID=UPI00188A76AE|nr:hypothetical protein [Flavobacterium sp. HJJ]MBF4473062.1 hypothetical protein [Flavobacterium sp. HJJ]